MFRGFVGLGIDDPVWHPTAFTTNRDRLLEGEVAARFLAAVLNHARLRQLLSREHVSVDGTLIEAWASMKSFRPKDGADVLNALFAVYDRLPEEFRAELPLKRTWMLVSEDEEGTA